MHPDNYRDAEVNASAAGLIRGKHGETYLHDPDRASQTLRALRAVLIGRSRASLVIEYQNLVEKERKVPTL